MQILKYSTFKLSSAVGISWNAPGVCTLFFGDERWEIERTYFAKQCCVIDLFFK